MRSLLAILLLATLGAEAQQIGQNAAPGQNDTPTLSVRSQIVIETVVVKEHTPGEAFPEASPRYFFFDDTAMKCFFRFAIRGVREEKNRKAAELLAQTTNQATQRRTS